ncbi:hypothetical protein SY88_10735 [Clostridiales bacterium PH28_bin88]|nr:hypothetical protein SY88_10735 [Clostridiales bacterium PH28_bin88]
MSIIKEDLHRLVEALPDREMPVAKRFLEFLLSMKIDDPLLRALEKAPVDDEPLEPEELAAIREAEKAIAQGDTIPWEQAKKELGL